MATLIRLCLLSLMVSLSLGFVMRDSTVQTGEERNQLDLSSLISEQKAKSMLVPSSVRIKRQAHRETGGSRNRDRAMNRRQKEEHRRNQLDLSSIISEQRAKSMLVPSAVRIKRQAYPADQNGFDERWAEDVLEGREYFEYKRRQCQASCWGAWKPYGACSVRCGSSGIKYSYRDRSVSSQCTSVINSHGCPGSNVRSAACGRSCNNGGTLRATSCSCPAGFKGTCCEQRVTCGFPGKPTNGAVSSGSSSHSYNARVTYSCNTGYRLSGSSSNVCQNNGQWKNPVPSCTRITCSKPSVNAHVSLQPSKATYDYSTRVIFSCPNGYTRQGADSATCTGSGAWSVASPTCQRISCSALSSPSNGGVTTSDGNWFRSTASFSCSSGYHLSGSTRRTCQINGQWDGTQPTCARVTCPRLSAITNGNIRQPNAPVSGNIATYSCLSGYEMSGNNRRTCTYSGTSATGSWSGSTPSCSAVSCGQPNTPTHGTRTGNTFTYRSTVSFRCEHGYYLQGDETITCQANKAWSGSSPAKCIACPSNTYKTGTNAARICTSCPANTHTNSQASSRVNQCLCNQGFEGPNGGPCTVLQCPAITAPANGVIGACARTYQSTCSVHCVQGYIRHQGDETRTCLLSKQWSGVGPTCRACPRNTYKASATTCANCPLNSETSRDASTLADCTCKSGFTKTNANTCADVNECASNNGGCEQLCTNLPGTYQCGCNDQFVKDSKDPKKCVAKNSCPALARPDNGGLVCVAEKAVNTERCSVKCNAGYQHIIRPNPYEECGPSTNFKWSTESNMTPVLGCIESFFGEIYIDGEAAYFTTSCDQVTGTVLANVRTSFLEMLQSRGICVGGQGQSTCSVDEITVECGATVTGRRKRDNGNTLKINFKVKVPSQSKLNTECKAKCEATSRVILFDKCYAACEDKVELQRRAVLLDAATKLGVDVDEATIEDLFPEFKLEDSETSTSSRPAKPAQSGSAELSVPGLVLRPTEIKMSGILSKCNSGMERRNNSCVPCSAGSYFSFSESRCKLCPRGQYQPNPGQAQCIPCPLDHHSPVGATSCLTTPTEEPVDFFVIIKPNLPNETSK